MTSLEGLAASVTAQQDVRGSVELLINDLVARIKATSNDQNIQRLARELETLTPALVRAIACKVD